MFVEAEYFYQCFRSADGESRLRRSSSSSKARELSRLLLRFMMLIHSYGNTILRMAGRYNGIVQLVDLACCG